MTKAVRIKDVMSTQLLWVGAEANLLTVSQLMAQRDVGSILVKSGENFVGIITEKDIIRKVVAKGLTAQSVTAEMAMSYPIASIDQEASLDEAHRTMGEQNIRHLLVTHKGKPAGMISVRSWLEKPK
jgi:signal-transduction protein with cAMP-binding, CBS, and nucleotidyltransferase domain